MKVAVIGKSGLAERVVGAIEDLGAAVESFCPREQPLHVQKRFLSLREEIPGRSRFYDLFRIVYQQQYTSHFKRQLDFQQGVIPGLGPNDMEYLLRPADGFVDVDVVVDTVGMKKSSRRAPLLNETMNPMSEMISVGGVPEFAKSRRVALVVGSERALEFLSPLVSWAQECGGELAIVGRSFSSVAKNSPWQIAVEREKKAMAPRQEAFAREMSRWESLEDYERAKVLRPVPPRGHLHFFEGYWPMGIDYLSDRKQGFLSLERPDFRGGEDLQTLEVDHVVFDSDLATEESPRGHCFGMREDERGYFVLTSENSKDWEARVGKLLDGMGQLFSQREKA